MSAVNELVSIASPPLSEFAPTPLSLFAQYGETGGELLTMLKRKNGYFAFESALHVFPACSGKLTMGLEQWNSVSLWKHAYDRQFDRFLFFAEDIFGDQFAISESTICHVRSETGESERFAASIEEWAQRILDEPNLTTGYPLAKEWQRENGALDEGCRLVAKIPFVLGGKYERSNFYAGDSIEAMRFRGDLARQIKDLPDGTEIVFRVE